MSGRSVFASSVLLALLCCGGCGEEAETARPVTATCLVQGRVGRVGSDNPTFVTLQTYVPNTLDRMILLETDAAGHYRVEVPAGDYLISADSHWNEYWHTAEGGMTHRRADADTVRLGPENSPYTADFPFGALRFQAELPDALEGGRIGIDVSVVDTTSSWPRQVGSGQATVTDGRIDLIVPGLPPGDCVARLNWTLPGNRSGERFWLPDADDIAEAATCRVRGDSLTIVPVTLASSPARLSGRVTGAWLAMGMAAPVVRAINAEGSAVVGPWTVNLDGSFELLLFRPEPVRLEVRIDNFRQWVGGTQLSNATVYAPEPGQVIDGIEYVSGGLRLRAIPSDLIDTDVTAYFEFYDPVGPTLRFMTSRRLEYQIGFANMLPGDWLVRVAPDPYNSQRWRPQWLDRRATAAAADILHVPGDGSVLTLDLVVEAGGVIGGRVVSATGVAASRTVVLTPSAARVNEAFVHVVVPDGAFSIIGLPEGGYRLGVVPKWEHYGGIGSQPPDSTLWYPGTLDWAAAQEIVITGAGTVDGLVLDIP